MRAFTPKEREAIKELEKAFAKCSRLGLNFIGMDDSLYCLRRETVAAADEDPAGCKSVGGYAPICCAIRLYDEGWTKVKAKSYIESGGW